MSPLSGLWQTVEPQVDEQEAGTREAVRGEKRHPADFALWKKAEPEHILRWNSPWGEGFPGWHIECSAMARKYLGPTFDIHGGGIDNIYPHNENEIAQSECANDAEFARYWMLVGSLMVPDPIEGIPVKMSKSLGNFVTIKDALAAYRPEVMRMFILSAHYSNPVNYHEEALSAASGGWERLYGAVRQTRQRMNSAPESDDGNGFQERLDKAKQDFTDGDGRRLQRAQSAGRAARTDPRGQHAAQQRASLGLAACKRLTRLIPAWAAMCWESSPAARRPRAVMATAKDGLIELLIDLRARARAEKNYAESDRIRDELAAMGVLLEDGPTGTIWRVN